MGEGEGVNVDVVLPFDDVFLLRDERIGVTDELPLVPLVELLGEVVLDMFLNADGTWDLLKSSKTRSRLFVLYLNDVYKYKITIQSSSALVMLIVQELTNI